MTMITYVIFAIFAVNIALSDRILCPPNQFFIYPCKCVRDGDRGVYIVCDDANLAMLSLGLANVKLPIESLVISNATIARLFGSIFDNLTVFQLEVINSRIATIADDVFAPLAANLRSLSLEGNRLSKIPHGAIIDKLTNLTRLNLARNQISEVGSDAFGKLMTSLVEVDLSHNGIKKLASSSFNGLPALETLHLHGNKLTKFERNQFKVTKKLKYLDISSNSFTEFGKSDFNDLTNIAVLNCSRNSLKDIARSLLARNSQLRVLNVSYNKLVDIDSYLLRAVRFLRDFDARGNEIKEVARRSFSSTTRLRSIDLAENRLTKIEPEVFKDLQWLDKLNLSRNRIDSLASGSLQRMYLVSIDLSYNNLTTIHSGAFQELANITRLDLSHNNISEIPAKAFDACDCTELMLNHNNITDILKIPVIANFTGIKFVNLSHNSIRELNRKAFTPKRLYELHTIDLSHNHIADLSGSVFEKFASIRYIHLSRNRLSKIGFGAFGSLPTLLELDLSYNNITEITSGGVSSLVSVKTLYVNNNRIKKMFAIPLALNEIHLEHNQLQTIGGNAFPMINSLLFLYLDYNNITRLEPNSFANLLSLQKLSLTGNNLTEVPKQALQSMTALRHLSLSQNHITKLERRAFGSLPIVFDLDLDQNQIDNVTVSAFDGMLQLLRLNMSHNRIEKLAPEVFKGCVSLQSLDLSYNQLTALENKTHGVLEDLLSLERINLSHNSLSFINDRTFPKSPYIPYKLTRVDLSYNLIPVLTGTFDDGMSKVEWLSLRHNIINEIRPNVISNITRLRFLDLSENQLQKLPRGVFSGHPTTTTTATGPSVSSSSFGLLPNLTHLLIARNKLGAINLDEIGATAKQIQFLDLSENLLTSIYDEMLAWIKRGVDIQISGNPIYCNCHVKPFIVWMVNRYYFSGYQESSNSNSNTNTNSVGFLSSTPNYHLLTCAQPETLHGKRILSLQPNQLKCNDVSDTSVFAHNHNSGESQSEVNEVRKSFEKKADLKFRGVEWVRRPRGSARFVWFVIARYDDVAGFRLVIHKQLSSSSSLMSEDADDSAVIRVEIGYNSREYLAHNLDEDARYRVCIKAIDSLGAERLFYPESQCTFFGPASASAFSSSSQVIRQLSPSSNTNIKHVDIERSKETNSLSSSSSSSFASSPSATVSRLVSTVYASSLGLIFIYSIYDCC